MKINRTAIILFLTILIFWFLDAYFDYLYFNDEDESFIYVLFFEKFELYFRSIISLVFIITAIIIQRYINKLHASETKFRIVADFTIDWETWINQDGKFEYISPSSEEITGYKVNEFYVNPGLITEICHPDDKEALISHDHRVNNTKISEYIEFRIITKNGDIRWIGHKCQPMLEVKNKNYGRRASNRDITNLKKLEVEKFKIQKYETLERANIELESIISIMSHNLKAPVRRINNLIDLLVNHLHRDIKENEKEVYNLISLNVENLFTMITNLIEYSELPKDTISNQICVISEIIEELVKIEFQSLIKQTETELIVELTFDRVIANRKLIVLLFKNIICNAIMYAHRNETPLLQIKSNKLGDFIKFEITHEGIAIPFEGQDKISISDQTSNASFESQGVGYAIINKIVKMHKGEMGSISNEEKQTVYWFTLPKAVKIT